MPKKKEKVDEHTHTWAATYLRYGIDGDKEEIGTREKWKMDKTKNCKNSYREYSNKPSFLCTHIVN